MIFIQSQRQLTYEKRKVEDRMQKNHTERKVLCFSGKDVRKFLQDLITNDISKVEKGLLYAALLGPQGKFLFDFFLFSKDDYIFLDCHTGSVEALCQRLLMYRLRKDVRITSTDLIVSCGINDNPEGAMVDPRHPDMGWRYYGERLDVDFVDWTALRIRLGIPALEKELLADTYILEMRFEQLNGADFRKGCYIGQEITARMKHKTELRKGIAKAKLSKEVPLHTRITSEGKDIGFVCSQSAGEALVYVRYQKIGEAMIAGDAEVMEVNPDFVT